MEWTIFVRRAGDDKWEEGCAFKEADVVPMFCSPFYLELGESNSAFITGVEFTPFTHTHVCFVDTANVEDAWLGTLRAFVRVAALSPNWCDEPVVIGAYVTRSSNNIWTLGIVTSKCPEGRDIQYYWTASISKFGGDFTPSLRSATEAVNGGFSVSDSFPGSPLRASQRHITVAAGWADDSVIERIPPGKRLPAAVGELILAGLTLLIILIIAAAMSRVS